MSSLPNSSNQEERTKTASPPKLNAVLPSITTQLHAAGGGDGAQLAENHPTRFMKEIGRSETADSSHSSDESASAASPSTHLLPQTYTTNAGLQRRMSLNAQASISRGTHPNVGPSPPPRTRNSILLPNTQANEKFQQRFSAQLPATTAAGAGAGAISKRPPMHSGASGGVINPSQTSGSKSSGSTSSHPRQQMAQQAMSWLYDYDGGDEEDDWLHVPGKERKRNCWDFLSVNSRACLNVGTMMILLAVILMLFAGYPLLSVLVIHKDLKKTGYGLGGSNGTGQVPELPNLAQLIDPDTPSTAYNWVSPRDQSSYHLVFSDEFNAEGRTFWPGDDPFWEAVDLNYWVTGDFEWYSPEAINTTNGFLNIWMEEKSTHNLNFQSGMLQSWNKFCFQGGYIEASIILPGKATTEGCKCLSLPCPNLAAWRPSPSVTSPVVTKLELKLFKFVADLIVLSISCLYVYIRYVLPPWNRSTGHWLAVWPAVWMMGNLGRAGYAGSTQGMWPYSYDTCDIGTLPNQTTPDKSGPPAALNAHGQYSNSYDNKISFLEGQRLSACTCSGEDHPGPSTNVGRSSPELDIVEAQVNGGHGYASQSLQIAPFDANYSWSQDKSVAFLHQPDSSFNSYTGGIYQEAVSGVSPIPDSTYENSGAVPLRFGVNYEPDWDNNGDGWVTWYLDGQPRWTVTGKALGPNQYTQIGQRKIPTEPLSIIINLAVSDGFQKVKWQDITFPASMKVDYIRVFQKDGQQDRISCDPDDHPTAKYIADHLDVYMNPNYTTFPQDKYGWPKNSLLQKC